ncbi:TMV resistance protein N-like, partial [Trifolium medium]|nr:TMV resistance protein N-like [Trifolium medium]
KDSMFEYELIENIVQEVEKRLPSRYNIFLSFSESTQYSFTNYLCDALDQEGFKTFRRDIICGENVPYQSSEAMAKSKLSIIIFCENYANSMSRLDELVTILDSMKKNNQLVWPIFYKVEPTNIRHQKMSYAEAMTEHEKNLKNDLNANEKVKKWKSALFEVANLKGWHLKFG